MSERAKMTNEVSRKTKDEENNGERRGEVQKVAGTARHTRRNVKKLFPPPPCESRGRRKPNNKVCPEHFLARTSFLLQGALEKESA
jgi:hypothetical protein